MTKNRTLTVASVIATVGLTALTMTGVSQAQVPPPRPAPPMAGAPARPAPPSRADIERRIAERRAEHAKDVATVLRLTPAQRPLLDALLASRIPPQRGPDAANRWSDPQARRDMTTQQRLDEQARRSDERRAQQTQRTDALRNFYAALNPEQKQAFDALIRLRAESERGRGHGGHRLGGHGGPGGKPGMMGMRRPGGPHGPGSFAPPAR